MKRNWMLLGALAAGIAIGVFVVRYTSSSKRSDVSSSTTFEWQRPEDSGLSPVHFAKYYFPVKQSIELKFQQQIAYVDGEIFAGSDLDAELLKKKAQKKARYLVLLGDDFDRFGPLVERISHYRSLGFEGVVLMGTH